jgi:hypothetical protein
MILKRLKLLSFVLMLLLAACAAPVFDQTPGGSLFIGDVEVVRSPQ